MEAEDLSADIARAKDAVRPIGSYKGFLCDLDGTLYLSDRVLPGAVEMIDRLRATDRRVVFLSNNPTRTRDEYRAKLERLGIPASIDEIVTSGYVMARYLSRVAPGAALYVVGEPPLISELASAGFRFSEDPGAIEYVVVGFDRTFDYYKLNIATQAIRRGAHFVATNPDRTCPVLGGEIPDCAAMIGAIEGATLKRVEVVVGKPSPIMVEVALEAIGLPASECAMIGDRLETDIVMGRTSGVGTVLVLSGISSAKDLELSDIRPDHVLNSVGEVLERL